MFAEEETNRFIRASFGSVWSLELLLLLRARPDHAWQRDELIAALRASEQVVARSSADLLAAGLAVAGEETSIRLASADPSLATMIEAVALLYETRPAKVRRLILGGTDDDITSFADAFRFRRD